MTERERSLQRPRNYLELSAREQWTIDKTLGILDWEGDGIDIAHTSSNLVWLYGTCPSCDTAVDQDAQKCKTCGSWTTQVYGRPRL